MISALGVSFAGLAQAFQTTRLGGSLEVGAEFLRQKFESRNQSNRRFERTRFDEQLSIESAGFLFNPKIFLFNLGITAGKSQEESDITDSASDSNDGDILKYNGQLNILPTKPVSLLLFGNRFENDISQSLGADTDSSGESLGATLRAGVPFFPSTLTWQKIDSRNQSRLGEIETRREETRELIIYSGQHQSETINSTLRLRREDVDDRSVPPARDYLIQEATGSIGLRWGDYLEKQVRIAPRYYERAGLSNFRTLSANSLLAWAPTDSLDIRVQHDINLFDSSDDQTTNNDIVLTLNHQWYESLRTNLRGFGDKTERDDGERSTYGGDLSFAYKKKLAWESRLLVNFRRSYRIEENDFRSDPQTILGEALTITGFNGNFLANARVDVGTIEIFDGINGPLLNQGIDYELDPIGDRLSINIINTGFIGKVLSVNYKFSIDPESKIETHGMSYGIGWESDWLRISYHHDELKEGLLKGERDRLQDSKEDRYRMDLLYKKPRSNASVGARYVESRSVSTDYNELAFEQSLTWAPSPFLQTNIRFSENFRDFLSPVRKSESYSSSASATWRPGGRHRLHFLAQYRELQDSESPNQRDLKLGVQANFRFFRLEIIPTVRWARRERGDSKSEDLRGIIRFRREF